VTPDAIEIRLRGRGGQGVGLGRRILEAAFARAGWRVRLATVDEDEPRGAPVSATVHLAPAEDSPACEGVARAALVLDPAMLARDAASSIADGGLVVVNAPIAPCGRMPGANRVVAVDANAIARRRGVGPVVVAAVLGAFAGASRRLALGDLLAALDTVAPPNVDAQRAACSDGWTAVVADAAA
jgi:Pyruvate/2-oxoacid:ferredoxin oxidoreductase gamma subunit